MPLSRRFDRPTAPTASGTCTEEGLPQSEERQSAYIGP